MMNFLTMSLQLPGHTCCVFPEETNQLQPPHQSQQPLLHLSGDGWNQPDPPHRLRERPASLLAAGASQRGPGQHEQRSRGLCVCMMWIPSHISAVKFNDWTNLKTQRFLTLQGCLVILHRLSTLQTISDKSSTKQVISFHSFLLQQSWIWSAVLVQKCRPSTVVAGGVLLIMIYLADNKIIRQGQKNQTTVRHPCAKQAFRLLLFI